MLESHEAALMIEASSKPGRTKVGPEVYRYNAKCNGYIDEYIVTHISDGGSNVKLLAFTVWDCVFTHLFVGCGLVFIAGLLLMRIADFVRHLG